jgi:uncharacterized protein YutE (UPF0331/DUF86 family)
MNEAILYKAQSIQRCIKRARQEYNDAGAQFRSDFTRQDASVLNITRAYEQAIDLANHVIRQQRLGIPGQSRQSFRLLAEEGIVTRELANRLGKMVGFRNIAIHQYEDLNVEILVSVITKDSDDLLRFSEIMLQHAGSAEPDESENRRPS